MDIFTKEKRHEIMSKIRAKDTKYEIMVRKQLYSMGFRYRKNYGKLPGRPDVFLLKHNVAIFINGCFWHGHRNCKYAVTPKTNRSFWEGKISMNRKRDEMNMEELEKLGVRVIVLWECELKRDFKDVMARLIAEISS